MYLCYSTARNPRNISEKQPNFASVHFQHRTWLPPIDECSRMLSGLSATTLQATHITLDYYLTSENC